MRICFVLFIGLVTLATLCSARPAENDADYDEEPAPAPKKPARPLTSRRNPLSGRSNAKPSSTTTTTAAPVEEEAVDEGDYDEELPAEQEPSSTTEAAKKNFLKSGVVRPFRSNDELLASLKKRREQAAYNKVHKPIQSDDQSAPAAASNVEQESTKKSSASSSGRRNRFNTKDKNAEAAVEEPASQAAPAKTGRRFGGRS